MTADALPTAAEVAERAAALAERIEAAGGDRNAVTVVAVTKAFAPGLARVALDAGLRDLGENYAQELLAKDAVLTPDDAARWHFIGGLQRNKVKQLAGRVHLWQSVDRASLVDEIAKRSAGDAVLIQVNTTDESQKSGCPPDEAAALVERARERDLTVRGLMTVGPTDTTADPRPSFVALRELAERCAVTELSMGMSGDFELAVAEGATIIRVGTTLFGPRPPRTTRTG